MNKPTKALLAIALIALGFLWRPAWGLLLLFLLVEWAESRWNELLEAIRRIGRRAPRDEKRDELQEEFEQQPTDEGLIEAAHKKSDYKHVPRLPWGDPSSYVKASTAEELARVAHNREIEQDWREQEEQRREEEAREFLVRESERVQKERLEREGAHETREREAQSKSMLQDYSFAGFYTADRLGFSTDGATCLKCGRPAVYFNFQDAFCADCVALVLGSSRHSDGFSI